MKRIHVVTVSLLLAGAAVLGGIAAVRTAHLGASARPAVTTAAISKRNKQLDGIEAALKRQLAQKPPAVAASPQSRQRVVFVRPAPIVHVVHRTGGEHEAESEGVDD